MLLKEIFLNEVHWTDLYPKSFADFRKKYYKLIRQKKTYDLYVQFTNFVDNTMDRTAWQKPDHHDPVGVYAYPINYVLKHPADVWYGMGSRYMRVIQAVSKNSFNLAYIDNENKVERFLRQLGYTTPQIHDMIWSAKKYYKNRFTGKNKFAKMFMTIMQLDFLKEPTENKGMFGPKKQFPDRSGAEQTALFRKLGIDAIIDSSSNHKNAIINEREPEQIIFLTRNAFRVLEVFDLRSGVPQTKLPSFTTSDPNTPIIVRPFISKLANVMDDKIKEYARDDKIRKKLDASYDYAWTVKGRRINIKFERPGSYYNGKKIGQKNHKENALSNSHMTIIEVMTEHGRYYRRFGTPTTFDEITLEFTKWWNDSKTKPIDPDWEPEDSTKFMAHIKAEKERILDERLKKEEKEREEYWPSFLEDVNYVANKVGMKFTPNKDLKCNAYLIQLMHWLGNQHITSSNYKTYMEDQERLIKDWAADDSEFLSLGPKYRSVIDQVKQLSNIMLSALKIAPTEFLRGREHAFGFIRKYLEDKEKGD